MTSDVDLHPSPAGGLAGSPGPARAGGVADPDDRPPLPQRLFPAMPTDPFGWIGPGLIAFAAGIMRFWRLGVPKDFVFDETYYAKDAWSLIHYGYERNWLDRANAQILAGHTTGQYSEGGAFVVHPPVGKWIIGLGEWLFGFNPLGWRIMVALLGTVSVLMVGRIARRMTRSTLLGCTASLLLAFDGLEYVMSRTGLLDLIVMFWVLAAFGCLILDRDQVRQRLAQAVERGEGVGGEWGPRFGWRPWRLTAGVCLGLAAGTKWSGFFVVMVFVVMTVLWDVGARHALGARRYFRAALVRDAPRAFFSVVCVALVVYLTSWSRWLFTSGGYDRDWAAHRGTAWPWIPAALRSLWHYQWDIKEFHVNLHAPHRYQSNPWSWLVIGRPVSYYFNNLSYGQNDCREDKCAQAVLGIGTPALWWTAILALGYLLWLWAGRRDWRAGAVLAAMAATYLPWFAYTDRTIFYFYTVVFVPYLVLAVTLMLGAVLGGAGASPTRRAWGASAAGVVVLLIVINFIYFYPILSAEPISLGEWSARMWFRSWI